MVLFSVCIFRVFALIAAGPTVSSGLSIVTTIAEPVVLLVGFGVLFAVRSMMPRGMMKIGISMLQIVASANSVYSIPWPSVFSNFLDLLKVFLVDVVTLTKANCARRMTYFESTAATLVRLVPVDFDIPAVE